MDFCIKRNQAIKENVYETYFEEDIQIICFRKKNYY